MYSSIVDIADKICSDSVVQFHNFINKILNKQRYIIIIIFYRGVWNYYYYYNLHSYKIYKHVNQQRKTTMAALKRLWLALVSNSQTTILDQNTLSLTSHEK